MTDPAKQLANTLSESTDQIEDKSTLYSSISAVSNYVWNLFSDAEQQPSATTTSPENECRAKHESFTSFDSFSSTPATHRDLSFLDAPSRIHLLGVNAVTYKDVPVGVSPIHLADAPAPLNPLLLTHKLAETIREHLPLVLRIADNWMLQYSMDRHGTSMKTLYESSLDKGPLLLIIQDHLGGKFGAFSNTGFQIRTGFHGNGDCFLWKFIDDADINVYHATGVNDYLVLCEPHCIAIGGGEGRFGLWIDDCLDNGHSERCATFNNDQLAADLEFHVMNLEIWSFKI